ncbi:MAG: hypothetical protein SPL69_10090, partial [Succinivibrionaceae bacterium]|nr:hypothetical protein [Succinivibrionaceae bacterium]
ALQGPDREARPPPLISSPASPDAVLSEKADRNGLPFVVSGKRPAAISLHIYSIFTGSSAKARIMRLFPKICAAYQNFSLVMKASCFSLII